MRPWLPLLAVALADAPEGAGFRVDEDAGWRLEGERLLGPGEQALTLRAEAGDRFEPLEVADIGRERAQLVVEMAGRKLIANPVEGRMVTTPLGEPQVLLQYGIKAGKGYEGAPPGRGVRLVRRCGPTVRITVEDEAAAPAPVLEAASQVIWAAPDCEHYNTRAFREVEAPALALPSPPPSMPAPEEESGSGLVLVGAAVLCVGAVVAWQVATRRRAPTPARPDPRRQGRSPEAPRPDPSRADPRPELPRPDPRPAPPGPRSLGALGAQEGVWVTPSAPARSDPLAVVVQRLGQVMGLDRAPPPPVALPDVPPPYLALLEQHDGASFGGGWLRLLGASEGRGFTVTALNAGIQGRVGRRFSVGYFADGALVFLTQKGEVQVARPGDRAPRTVAPNLTAFLGALADDLTLRSAICSHQEAQASQRALGPLGPDQVFEGQGTEARKVSILELWERAPSLL